MLTISVLCASYSSAFSFFFFFLMLRRPPRSTLFPYTTSSDLREERERPGSQLERVMVHEPLRVNGAGSVAALDRKSTRLNSSHVAISYAVFCLKKKKENPHTNMQQTTACYTPHFNGRQHKRAD